MKSWFQCTTHWSSKWSLELARHACSSAITPSLNNPWAHSEHESVQTHHLPSGSLQSTTQTTREAERTWGLPHVHPSRPPSTALPLPVDTHLLLLSAPSLPSSPACPVSSPDRPAAPPQSAAGACGKSPALFSATSWQGLSSWGEELPGVCSRPGGPRGAHADEFLGGNHVPSAVALCHPVFSSPRVS